VFTIAHEAAKHADAQAFVLQVGAGAQFPASVAEGRKK
jgi:hypothetical protein